MGYHSFAFRPRGYAKDRNADDADWTDEADLINSCIRGDRLFKKIIPTSFNQQGLYVTQ